MFKDRKKTIVHSSDGSITRLARNYNKLHTQLKHIKEERGEVLEKLRSATLGYFQKEDADTTRVLKTNSVSIIMNKETQRKVTTTDMEAVFETICNKWNIKRNTLSDIVDSHTSTRYVDVKSSLKVEEL
jgi:hypothetical protein